MIDNYLSFCRFPKVKHENVIKLNWLSELPDLTKIESKLLPYGNGKSYGDSCLNENGILIDTRGLNRLISWDASKNLIRCESGVMLSDLLDFLVPRGKFLASTPGTKKITVGGAIGNDVHGKNHHKGGTFGCHVTQFELLRSDGKKYLCSPNENIDLFKATIGGLGLTGLITWAEFYVQDIPSPYIGMDSIKFDSLEDFFEINTESNLNFDYTVSWIDCTAKGGNFGRGIYSRGNFIPHEIKERDLLPQKAIPFFIDAPFINNISVNAFNMLYFNKQFNKIEKIQTHYNPFFYPLDAVDNWHLAYGKNGFLQYQFVVPFENDYYVVKDILKYITESGLSSFLTVLKSFGSIKSPGMLSFPRPGITLAIDFRIKSDRTFKLLQETDKIVAQAGGVIYPGKDARMSAEHFQQFYPQWKDFSKYIDPKFSSSFWRRVTQQ